MRYCLPHSARLKAQGPRQKGVRTPDRLVLDLDALRDSSTFASGQHKKSPFFYKGTQGKNSLFLDEGKWGFLDPENLFFQKMGIRGPV